eukprot:TRINITY_DN4124_c0_g1_i1.p1 TRINITY_DN4124_c0_g1~~TRINITY_DN4124_c0_g1_i1.p1  ORF type:complete len:453 (+),score=193.93 TRINITY_DN4124_c0_g1_i1:186-1361(+)
MQQDPAALSFPGCSICFEPLDGHTNGGLAAIKCGHVYHEACLSLWSNTHNSCPQCKQSGAKRATRLYYQAETADASASAARVELAAARGALNAAEIERIKKDKELLRERRRSERLAADIGALRQRQQQDGYLHAFVDAVGAGDASLDLKFTQATANIMAGGKSWSTFASEQHKMLSYQQGEYKKLFKTNLSLEQQKLELTAAKEEADYQVKSLTQQLKQASHRLRQEQEKLQEHIAEAKRRTAAVAPGPATWGVLPQKRPSDDAEIAPLFAKPAAKALKRSSSSSGGSGGIGAAAAAALSVRPSAQDASGGSGGGSANVARAQLRYQSHVNNLQPAKGAATKAPAAAKSSFSGVAQRAQNMLVPNMFATSAMYAKKAPSKQPAAFLRAHGP